MFAIHNERLNQTANDGQKFGVHTKIKPHLRTTSTKLNHFRRGAACAAEL